MNKNRWPKSIHCQMEAIFHVIRSIRKSKMDSMQGIRSFGTWRIYKYEAHRFASFMASKGRSNILNVHEVRGDMIDYLSARLDDYVKNKRSRQSMKTILSAFAKFEYALNSYIEIHMPGHPKLDTKQLRMDFYARSKRLLPRSSALFESRAYPYPIQLIEMLTDETFQLQASLEYEGGLRTEGVGAPSNPRIKNPLCEKGLCGIVKDPVSGLPVGVVSSVEKGGKQTKHFISMETYQRLKKHVEKYGKLESRYKDYVEAINRAAKATNQYARGRGSHGLKFNFAQERYLECVQYGLTHEQALQQTSLETSHFRLRETLGYTKG